MVECQHFVARYWRSYKASRLRLNATDLDPTLAGYWSSLVRSTIDDGALQIPFR
jgi:hypothetical protein